MLWLMNSGGSNEFEELASQVLSQASALLVKITKCVSRCQSIPASIYLFELRCIKMEMSQAHFTCGLFALDGRYESTWNVFVPISGVGSPGMI